MMKSMSFSSTGLPTATRTHCESLIANLDGTSTRTMSAATTHLIVPNDFASLPSGPANVPPTSAPKLLGALKWKCKVVTAQWVVDVARRLVAVGTTTSGGYELPWWPSVEDEAARMRVKRVLESLGDSSNVAPPPIPAVPVQEQQLQPPPVKPPPPSSSTSKKGSSQRSNPRSKFRVVSSESDSDSCTTTDDGSDHNDDNNRPATTTSPPQQTLSPPPPPPSGRLFSGYALSAAGFPPARLARLRSLVHQHAGIYVDSIPASAEGRVQSHPDVRKWVLVLPMVLDAELAKCKTKYAAGVRRGEVVVGSENWLQHCLLDNTIHPLTRSPLFHPLHLSRLPALSSHLISLSGFSEIDQSSLESILAALGASLSPSLTRSCTLLLYSSPTPTSPAHSSSKFDKAMQWNIPVVPLAWLDHVLATRAYARPDKYRLKPTRLIFEGLVVYVTGKVKASAAGGWVAGVVEVHGGKCVFAWSSTVTHVVHVAGSGGGCALADGDEGEGVGAVVSRKASLGGGGGASGGEGEREVKLAKQMGKHVVSPWWVSDSVQAKHRLPEHSYPPNYDPARQLHIINAPAALAQPLETYRAPTKPARALETPATARIKKVRRAYDPDVVIVSAADGSPAGYEAGDADGTAGGAGTRKRAKVVAVRSSAGGSSGQEWRGPQAHAQETPSRPPRGPDQRLDHRGHEQQVYVYEQHAQDVDMDADDYDDSHMNFESTARPPTPPPASAPRPHTAQVAQQPAPHPSSSSPPAQHQPRPPTPPPPTPPPPTKLPTPPPPPPSVDPIAQDLARKQAQMTADLELMLADLSAYPHPPAPAAPIPAVPVPAPPSPTTTAPAVPASTSDTPISLSAIYTQPGGRTASNAVAARSARPLVTYDDPEGAKARKKLIAATTRGMGESLARIESGGSTASSSSSSTLTVGSGRQWAALAVMMKNHAQGAKKPPELARSESESSVVRKMVEDARLGSAGSGSGQDQGQGDVSMSEATDVEVNELASDTTRAQGSVHMQQPRPSDAADTAMDVASTSARDTSASTIPLPLGAAGATSQLPNALLAPVRPAPPPIPQPNAPRVALSGCTADRDMYQSMIVALGGHLMSNPTSTSSWVEGTTHLVISVPISCEKCMCAIASGAWLLRPSYIEASYRAGRWVGEQEHTWAAVPRNGDARRREVVEAGERVGVERMDVGKSLELIAGWERVFRTIHEAAGSGGRGSGGGGAFRGWRVVLAGAANTSSYRNLLVAGGAVVVPDVWDIDKDPDAVTHVLVQSNRLDPHLATNDIVRSKTYSATLIIQSLMGDQPPTPVLLRRMSSRSFGTASSAASSSASSSGSASVSGGGGGGGGGAATGRGLGQAGHVRPPPQRQQASRVQSVDAASTGSTAY